MSDGLAERVARIAVRSLLREAEAGPKPGLVDRFGPGAHADMDIRHFRLSAAALGPYFRLMAAAAEAAGREAQTRAATVPETAARPDVSRELAATLRGLGVEAEAAMLRATGGVNTHKGAIWTLGLLCAAAGTLGAARYGVAASGSLDDARHDAQAGAPIRAARPGAPTAEMLCDEAGAIARDILGLAPATGGNSGGVQGDGAARVPSPGPGRGAPADTHGLAAKREYGLRSARDEAAAGFPAIRGRALTVARASRGGVISEDELVISVLLGAMTACDDTCLVARGGPQALARARNLAERILKAGGSGTPSGAALYAGMVAEFAARRLSPGGSADLCAAALFLADVETGAGFIEEAARTDRREHRACLARA